MVVKKIFEGNFDEEVHNDFLKFGRGEYNNRYLLEGKKQAGPSSESGTMSKQALKPDFQNQGPEAPSQIRHSVQTGQRQAAGALVPKVSTGSASIASGHADQNSLMGVIARKNSSFTRCYERALKENPNLAGRLAYDITVSQEGHVLDLRFTENTVHSNEVTDCIKAVLMRLVFPPLREPVIFNSVLILGTS